MTRAGIVTVAGKPNAGKSTLLNRLVGEKLAITSPKAQSTRHRVVGLRTEHDTQMVVLDTPGLLDPRDLLHEAMRGASLAALRDADVIVYVVDVSAIAPHALQRWVDHLDAPTEPVRSDAEREILRNAGLERSDSALLDAGKAPWPSLDEAASLERSPRASVLIALNKSDAIPEALRERIAQRATDVRCSLPSPARDSTSW
jgi:tRNA U34 5-carboxymethylaminomethyl modifying GTPase MnmE/TrmE